MHTRVARSLRRYGLIASVALLGACGARSSLDDAFGDAGPSTTTGTGAGGSGAGGVGGAGAGGSEPCELLLLDGPPRVGSDPIDAAEAEGEAALVAVDGARVMLFHTMRDDAEVASRLRATTFAPWGAWPDLLGDARPIATALREGVRIAPGFAGDAVAAIPLFSLGRSGATTAVFAPSVEPDTDYVDVPYEYLALQGSLPGRPTAFATGGGLAMLSWTVDAGPSYTGQLLIDDAGDVVHGPWYESACAQGKVRGAALAVAGGFLVAHSAGRDFNACLEDDGVITPATRLQLTRWSADANAPTLGEEREAIEPFELVELLPRAGGAWLVSQTDGSTSRAPPRVWAQPVDFEARLDGEQVTVLEDGRSSGPVAVSAFGSGFAVVWVESTAGAPQLGVRVFDASGALEAETTFDPSPWPLGAGRLALTSSDASGQPGSLVVAWQSSGPDRRVAAARLRCQVALP